MTLLGSPPQAGREAVAGYADSGSLPAGGQATFFAGCDHTPGPWTAIRYTEVPPGAGQAFQAAGREQVLLVVSGHGTAEAGGTREQAGPGDAFTCPDRAAWHIGAPDRAGAPVGLLVVEAFPGSPQRRQPPQRFALAARLAGCAGYRGGGHEQETLVAVAEISRCLTGRWHRLTLIQVEPGGTLGEACADGPAEGWRRPATASEVLFTLSGTAEITAGGLTADNRDRPGRRLCVGVPPAAAVLARNLAAGQPLLLASIEMGVPA